MAKRRNQNAWKHAERKVAELTGGYRAANDGHGGTDILHPLITADVKTRAQNPTCLIDVMQMVEASGMQVAQWGTHALMRLRTLSALLHGTANSHTKIMCIDKGHIKGLRQEVPSYVQGVVEHMQNVQQHADHKLPCGIFHYPRKVYDQAIVVAPYADFIQWGMRRVTGYRLMESAARGVRVWVNSKHEPICVLSNVLDYYANPFGRVSLAHQPKQSWGSGTLYLYWPEGKTPMTGNHTAFVSLRDDLMAHHITREDVAQVLYQIVSSAKEWDTSDVIFASDGVNIRKLGLNINGTRFVKEVMAWTSSTPQLKDS